MGTTHLPLARAAAQPRARVRGRRRVPQAQPRTRGGRGLTRKQWLYRNQLAPVAELDGQGNIVATFGYATHVNVPDYMLRGGTLYRVITDQLGSVRLVVNASDASDVLFRAEYSAFGQMTVLTGSAESVGFGFAGGMFDADTALVRFGARDYDAEVGRWISKDPTLFGGGQANLYVYTQNDPVNFVDPQGREAIAATLLVWGAGFLEGTAAAAAAPVAATVAVGTLVYVAGTQAIDSYFNTIAAGQNAEAIAMASAATWTATDAIWYAKKTGKERASDIPSWAKGNKPNVGETAKEFAERLLTGKYGPGNYPTGPGSEFNKVKKWGDRCGG